MEEHACRTHGRELGWGLTVEVGGRLGWGAKGKAMETTIKHRNKNRSRYRNKRTGKYMACKH